MAFDRNPFFFPPLAWACEATKPKRELQNRCMEMWCKLRFRNQAPAWIHLLRTFLGPFGSVSQQSVTKPEHELVKALGAAILHLAKLSMNEAEQSLTSSAPCQSSSLNPATAALSASSTSAATFPLPSSCTGLQSSRPSVASTAPSLPAADISSTML
jgi:hypothetical protein